ncbi:type II toxin-antitoxin system RelE/ParE family toxin [Paraneptunicella aestuarii]|uniref:type II toxin-antitoxin system RelE/ParE family toxin n=1 Tax=Paraneptunicella aestuarii TaxID=2831148 RepID=UPI001E32FC67|nr:type II toxin-antitoxin system RelE/ParE family toxin [Paraneptunicella aestuarii]UAA39803.1 type II toxin-antitoxin system RelE/ParE family toxin [Paraneptunicella aestuarii]
MLLIHIQVKAKDDLKKILIHSIEQWGLERAEQYYDELGAGITSIAENPQLGFARDDLKTGYRQLTVAKHCVFYRVSKSKIHVIRILHERMLKSGHL